MTAEQQARLRTIGKQGFIREEMTRLGYWPPSPEAAEKAKDAEAQLGQLYRELARLKGDLADVEKEIAAAGDIPALLAEIRRKRIERVRNERAKRKTERAAERAAKQQADREWREKTLPFLGRGVSVGLNYKHDGEDAPASNALARENLAAAALKYNLSDSLAVIAATQGLPLLASAADIADANGITTRELAWLAYHREAAGIDHYNRFTIPKKRKGGVRVISSPKKRLRVAQEWMLATLLEKLPVHDAAMAFRPGRSVVDNATRHAGQGVIIRIDLKDFFPSVGVRRVKKLFQSLGYNEGVATILALLATETPRVAVTLDGQRRFAAIGLRALPQGACTSPAITNLICRQLDKRLTGLAEASGWTYTRYADDLVFSHPNDTNDKDSDARVGLFLATVRRIVSKEEFVINEEKTVVLRPHHRQAVTGLVVNKDGASSGPRVSRDDLRRFRALLHHCEKDGVEAVSQRLGKDALAHAAGYLSFLHMSRPDKAQQIAAAHPWLTRWKAEQKTVV